MSASPSPEILPPANSLSTSSFPSPLSQLEPAVSPFPSPLPPSPPSPLSETPPPADHPIPPEISISPSPPPPVPPVLPPPFPAPAPDVAASPPPPPSSPLLSPPPIPSEPPPESPLASPPPPLPPSTDTPPPEAPEIPDSPLSEPPSITSPAATPTPTTSSPAPSASPVPAGSATLRPRASVSPPSPPIPTTPSPAVIGSLPAAVQIRKPGPNVKLSPGFIAGSIVVSLVVVLVVVAACVVFCKRRRRSRKSIGLPLPQKKPASFQAKDNFSTTATLQSVSSTIMIESDPSQGVFGYEQLAEATGFFSEANVVGEGGFGCVYRGVLAGGTEVAVKQLRSGSRQGEREFRAEVDIISRIHHKHLVSLLGFCITGAERLLVYEFIPNNTLEFHLHENHQHVLEWATRLRIAIGAAKGLAYLHEDCNPKIIHRDIKASNILLDFRFEAKVSDFGLAKSFSDTSTHISTRVVGTFGYLAPEYASSGKVTEKSDLYSFGVVLLELITGQRPICTADPTRNQGLVEWARPLLAQAMDDRYFDTLVDSRLGRNYDAAEMYRMVSCAAACVRHSAWLRPRMSRIVHALEGHAALTDLHEGIALGNSTLYTSPGSSNNAQEYRNNLKEFNMTITDQGYGKSSVYSGTTSEYGFNPSVSTGEK